MRLFTGVLISLFVSGIFIFNNIAQAARYIEGGNGTYTLSDQTIDQNLYISGSLLKIDADINGDLVSASRDIVSTGDINGNAFIAGSRVQLDGTVSNDVAIAAGTVVLNGKVSGDVRIFAGKVYINSPEITGDLQIFAQSIVIDDNVVIKGDKKLESNDISEGKDNQINTIDKAPITFWDMRNNNDIRSASRAFYSFFKVVSFIGWLLAGLFLIWLFKTRAFVIERTVRNSSGLLKSFLWGILILILGSILGLFLLISFIGIPLMISLVLITIVAGIFGSISVISALGCTIYNAIAKKETNLYLGFIIGFIIIGLVGFIPIIGGLVNLFIWVTGIGAFIEARRYRRAVV